MISLVGGCIAVVAALFLLLSLGAACSAVSQDPPPRPEPPSPVTLAIRPTPGGVMLNVTHDNFPPESKLAMDELVAAGVLRHYGVSVEKVEQAMKALEYPGVASVQIIFNMVRQRPADRFLAEAARRDVGILARVPLAPGEGDATHDPEALRQLTACFR